MSLRLLCAGILAGMALSAWADEPSAQPTTEIGYHPCKEIMSACQAAGYFDGGGSEGKGLWVNCMQPIMKGTKLLDVEMDPKIVRDCTGKAPAPKSKTRLVPAPTSYILQQQMLQNSRQNQPAPAKSEPLGVQPTQ